jgi:hypothetical protein
VGNVSRKGYAGIQESQAIFREDIPHNGPEESSRRGREKVEGTRRRRRNPNPDSGSKKVDKTVGKSFQGLKIATRVSVSIFLYSFSGGQEKGAHIGEVKRSATTTENPSSVVSEAVDQLKSKLFFLQSQNDKYFFSNQPNLNRILLTKVENIKDRDLLEIQKETIKQQITGGRLQVFLWPDKLRS